MSQRALRCPSPSVIVLGLLLLGAAGAAAAAEEGPRVTPQERPLVHGALPSQAASCDSCALAYQKCFATCFTDSSKRVQAACLTACDKAAARCTCDGAAILRSEDLVRWGLVSITKDGCHATSLCPSSFASCAGWSPTTACGPTYCQNETWCGACGDNGCDPSGPANYTPYEKYRVCFDPFGNSCTEWVSFDAGNCGC
jgi:hypothetical protein